ncbi:hypothetical protein SCHPADRAFT_1000925 [Schizopora paradoxa]|uniref:F-box domain-containing protein n=1 Tax=Schizopora paradoxa TaxID=27342 RepID=A0A0H2R9G6_9AGAM|nr:hypothetical protein SCHPADRAFT_1000925 [Schizopora paradoxa]
MQELVDQPQDDVNQATGSPRETLFGQICRYPIGPGLDLILSELESVRQATSRGQIDEDWQFSDEFHDSLWRDYKEEHDLTNRAGLLDMDNRSVHRFKELLSSVYMTDLMMNILDVMRSAVKTIKTRAITELECVGAKFGQLLDRLPQEILGETMRFACADVFDLIKLSHVNCRFRRTALGLSSMWSEVSSDMSTGILRLCLERSGNAPLQVVFNEKDKKYSPNDLGYLPTVVDPMSARGGAQLKVKDFVAEAVSSSSRWKSMEFRMPFSRSRVLKVNSKSFSLYLWLAFELKNLDFSRLESLSIKHQGCLPDERGSDFASSREGIISFMCFYSYWRAPKLHFLSFTGLVPAPIPGASIEALDLNIEVSPEYMDFFVALQDLSAFLAETPSLGKVTLRVLSTGYTDGEQTSNFPTVVLENLKALRLHVAEVPPILGHNVSFASFVDSLRIPSLTTLDIKIFLSPASEDSEEGSEGERDMTELMNSLIPNAGTNPCIQDFSVLVYDLSKASVPVISLALDNFPSLRVLTVGVGINAKLRIVPGSALNQNVKRNRSLQEITVQDCAYGVDEFLAWVAEELREHGGMEQLKVTLRRCEFTSEHLAELVSPNQLEVEGYPSDGRIIMWVERNWT